MDFFKKYWVEIIAFILLIVGIVLLAIEGFTKVEVDPIIEAVWVIVDLIANLIYAIKKLLQKKKSALNQ